MAISLTKTTQGTVVSMNDRTGQGIPECLRISTNLVLPNEAPIRFRHNSGKQTASLGGKISTDSAAAFAASTISAMQQHHHGIGSESWSLLARNYGLRIFSFSPASTKWLAGSRRIFLASSHFHFGFTSASEYSALSSAPRKWARTLSSCALLMAPVVPFAPHCAGSGS